jgi:hypothetical protein
MLDVYYRIMEKRLITLMKKDWLALSKERCQLFGIACRKITPRRDSM